MTEMRIEKLERRVRFLLGATILMGSFLVLAAGLGLTGQPEKAPVSYIYNYTDPPPVAVPKDGFAVVPGRPTSSAETIYFVIRSDGSELRTPVLTPHRAP